MSQEGLTDAPHPRSHPESGPLLPVIAPVADFLYPFCKEGGPFMTIHIQMLQEIATNAQGDGRGRTGNGGVHAGHRGRLRPAACPAQGDGGKRGSRHERSNRAGRNRQALAPQTTIVELRAFVAERSTPENRRRSGPFWKSTA